jgi:hypothetical protein
MAEKKKPRSADFASTQWIERWTNITDFASLHSINALLAQWIERWTNITDFASLQSSLWRTCE